MWKETKNYREWRHFLRTIDSSTSEKLCHISPRHPYAGNHGLSVTGRDTNSFLLFALLNPWFASWANQKSTTLPLSGKVFTFSVLPETSSPHSCALEGLFELKRLSSRALNLWLVHCFCNDRNAGTQSCVLHIVQRFQDNVKKSLTQILKCVCKSKIFNTDPWL